MLKRIQACFSSNQVLYSQHAKLEMEQEEYGEIQEQEVAQIIANGTIIEHYEDDKPYQSCLIYGKTGKARPLHAVCAYNEEDDLAIVITVYQPDPDKWENFTRRKE